MLWLSHEDYFNSLEVKRNDNLISNSIFIALINYFINISETYDDV